MNGQAQAADALDVPERVLVDGCEVGTIDAVDRGLHFGDGVFETLVCRQGALRFLELHLERLRTGCRRLGLPAPDPATLRTELRALALPRRSCVLKLILTRGSALRRGYGATGAERPRRVLLRYGLVSGTDPGAARGVRVRIARLRLGENPALAGLKHLNRLENVLARNEWHDVRIAEALLFSHAGRLVSGTMSNVFLVNEGRLMTPRVDRCGVAGVMRRVVLREALRCGLEASEAELDAAALARADEVFLTNARIGIWPVRALGERRLVPGPVTRQLQALVGELDA